MANGLYPSYQLWNYQTDKSLHSCTLPTRAYSPGGAHGSYEAWDSTIIDLETMVQNLVAEWVASFPTTTTFLDVTTYIVEEPGSQSAIPVDFYVIVDGEGTNVGAGVDAAQATWSFRTTAGGQSRLVGLDIAPNTEFRPRRPGAFLAADVALESEWTNTANAWSGRDGYRPSQLHAVLFTLNDALRRAYKYT